MKETTIRACLALHRNPYITETNLRKLILSAGSIDNIFQLSLVDLKLLKLSSEAQQAIAHYKNTENRNRDKNVDQDYRLIDSSHVQILPLCSDLYPELLKQIHDPPPLLYVLGDTATLGTIQLGMVGSRKPTKQGSENAFRFAQELASAGFTITSGMALGVDAQSHKGALTVSNNTVAVLGTGVDKVYPRSNHSLYETIKEKGAVVSEFPLGSAPRREHFPKRNRLISGLSLGVVVIEAALKSGSLISARCALEQNREVFALPGSIHNPMSKGCNTLIQQGAKLVENTADIIEEFKGWVLPKKIGDTSEQEAPLTTGECDLDPREQQLLNIMGYDPAPIDLLLQRCEWSVPLLSGLLSSLELKGLIENLAGRYQRIR